VATSTKTIKIGRCCIKSNLQTLIQTTEAITDLLDSYELAEVSEKVRAEIINEISDLTVEMLTDLDSMKDKLGSAFSILAAAIDLPNCEECKYED
jgi:hypothetical protein